MSTKHANKPIKVLYRSLLYVMPRNRLGDNVIAFFRFVAAHRRFPTRRMVFNDVLYRIKTTSEIIDPLRVFVTDKEYLRIYVKAKVGDSFNVPAYAVLRSMQEVLAYTFPDDCYIKPSHLSGTVLLRRAGDAIDFLLIRRWFVENYYLRGREANYKSLSPKVIVEPFIFGRADVSDYKLFCWRGEVKLIQVDIDRHTFHSRKYYDVQWRELPFSIIYPRSSHIIPKPSNLSQMVDIAEKLSAPFSFVRVDLYTDGERCLVGEITHCSENASGNFLPKHAEEEVSRWLFSLRATTT